MRKVAGVIFAFCISSLANADNCEEYLSYSDHERSAAALDVLTNAEPTRKLTIAILLGKACEGGLPEFSRAEANKDAGMFLPYLRSKGNELGR